MITVYDLESFSTIESQELPAPQPVPEYAPAAELRLQLVAESSSSQAACERDYSAVIAAQALAKVRGSGE